MKTLIVIGLAAALAGCAQARFNAANEEMEKQKAVCRSAPKTTHVELARCINGVEERGYQAAGIGSNDLVSVRLATRMAIAEKQDKGQMTQAEAELEFAKVNQGLTSTLHQRAVSTQTANAMTQMANPGPTTCNRVGNSVTCF